MVEDKSTIMFRIVYNYGLLFAITGLLMGGCTSKPQKDAHKISPNQKMESPAPTEMEELTSADEIPVGREISLDYAVLGLTQHTLIGNRWVKGTGTQPDHQMLDLTLDGTPVWLVAAPLEEGSIWFVTLEDGSSQGYFILGDQVQILETDFLKLQPDMPPILSVRHGQASLISIPVPDLSPNTHIAPIPGFPDHFAYISTDGDVGIWDGSTSQLFQVDAPLDARILSDESGRLLLLGGATDRYGHGVLGDRIESSRIVLIGTNPVFKIEMQIEIPEPAVIEGIAPIWADMNEDGEREIIVTLSDEKNGARIAAFSEDGSLLAQGPAIGQGYRWRHPLVVAPFGPEGQSELAVVRTPHIGGIVEFYRFEGDSLNIVAQIPGFSTHTIGSRNLDNALAGDFDGDGNIELMVPNQAHNRLEAIRRTGNAAEVVWSLPFGSVHTTNLVGVNLSSGEIILGVGTQDNILRLWIP
jgi:hypothetical protein